MKAEELKIGDVFFHPSDRFAKRELEVYQVDIVGGEYWEVTCLFPRAGVTYHTYFGSEVCLVMDSILTGTWEWDHRE